MLVRFRERQPATQGLRTVLVRGEDCLPTVADLAKRVVDGVPHRPCLALPVPLRNGDRGRCSSLPSELPVLKEGFSRAEV